MGLKHVLTFSSKNYLKRADTEFHLSLFTVSHTRLYMPYRRPIFVNVYSVGPLVYVVYGLGHSLVPNILPAHW